MATPLAPAGTPAPLVPALAAKPSGSVSASISPASPVPATPGSITSKEWVIPPRPKPGRKPATDTPPTKRKAQNRAAQRAFRERRAARVNELEDQIKQIEDEHDMHVAAFKEQITNLSHEVEQCRNEMAWWRDRCHGLEKEVSVEKSAKESLVKEFRSSFGDKSSGGGSSSSTDAVPLPARQSTRKNNNNSRQAHGASTSRSASHHHHHQQEASHEDVPMGCGSCSTSHCQCVEDAFAMPGVENQESKRASEPEIKPEPEEMEIDFTARFAQAPRPAREEQTSPSIATPVDPCGFCQDGTPCICAEMAAQEDGNRPGDNFENNRLAPIQNLSQFTPPPSDGDVRSEVTLPSISEATNSCANGPGTCAQCMSDPRSTLFCKTLAAARSGNGSGVSSSGSSSRTGAAAPAAPAAGGGGCCGGKGADGGCCQSRNPPITTTNSNNNHSKSSSRGISKPTLNSRQSPSLTLSCADAFTTLSRHPKFSRASDDLSSWLPKLHMLPNPRDLELADKSNARAAMEVEAASVMGVLRYFDRRFADK